MSPRRSLRPVKSSTSVNSTVTVPSMGTERISDTA